MTGCDGRPGAKWKSESSFSAIEAKSKNCVAKKEMRTARRGWQFKDPPVPSSILLQEHVSSFRCRLCGLPGPSTLPFPPWVCVCVFFSSHQIDLASSNSPCVRVKCKINWFFIAYPPSIRQYLPAFRVFLFQLRVSKCEISAKTHPSFRFSLGKIMINAAWPQIKRKGFRDERD